MGGRPLTALNILGIPADLVPPRIMNLILRGGAAKIKEAKCVLIGGHTIRNPEPIYGLAVTGLVSPRRMLTNAKARAGDVLVLTKPLGTGIITTGIKRGLTNRLLERKVIAVMTKLNSVGPELAERGLLKAAVDVTGFGLLGHLGAMCRASGVGAEIAADAVPVISAEVFQLIAAGCIPGGSRDNLDFREQIHGMGRRHSGSKNTVDGCADERRSPAERAAAKSGCGIEASEDATTHSAPPSSDRLCARASRRSEWRHETFRTARHPICRQTRASRWAIRDCLILPSWQSFGENSLRCENTERYLASRKSSRNCVPRWEL